ncbi:peptidylprolyl isomerase [Fulvivirga aurantia]|uniref:peptidylprolyl isomerase n=1 Tax=Fulvivirga aurantia TaxID=2529383 RepID=UPI001FECF141|nr:peptidylprolyl isomerase [Fulvivirga aurantia]
MKNLLTNRFLIVLALAVLTASCTTEKEYLVTIKTDYGDMHAILYDQTPEHKKNFIKLAKEGFYDSLLFHRVIEDFMIQGGDPNSKTAKQREPLGSGGVDYTIPAEFNENLFHKKGALSAARQGDRRNPEKRSSGSQFYIVQGKKLTKEEVTTDMEKLNKAIGALLMRTDYTEKRLELQQLYENEQFDEYSKEVMELRKDVEEVLKIDVSKNVSQERIDAYTNAGGVPHLDDTYTVFGQVIDGLEVIDKIAAQETYKLGPRNPLTDRPKENIRFYISVDEMPKRKIEKEFNYTFPEIEE